MMPWAKCQCLFSACLIKIVIVAIITTVRPTSPITLTPRIIRRPSVITLSVVPVTGTRTRIIAGTVEIIAVDVDASGPGVGRGVVPIAVAVGVVEVRTAAGRSEVAVSIRMLVAVLPLTYFSVTGIHDVEPVEILSVDCIPTFRLHRKAYRPSDRRDEMYAGHV